jgi:transketolase
MRQACFKAIYQIARQDERIVFIGSDLGQGTLEEFKREMPRRFFMEGVSEAHVVGMAAGLALEGKIPFVCTIASFLTRRCYEQVFLDLGLHGAKVRLVGLGGGLVYGPLGPTHMATDDFALMRAVPGMTVIAPADTLEMQVAVKASVDCPGPVYLRVARGGEPTVIDSVHGFEIGKGRVLRSGDKALLVTTGIMAGPALQAAKVLSSSGVEISILHLPTIKPLDVDSLLEAVRAVPAVFSLEEHVINGGLGSAVAETIAEAGFQSPKRFRRLGLKDAFSNCYGSQALLLERYELSAENIARVVFDELKKGGAHG